MTTYTIFGDAADGRVVSTSTVYVTARSGGTISSPGGTLNVGQEFTDPNYTCYETFVGFDTSTIGDTEVVSSATLSLYGGVDSSTTDFTANARVYNWGITLGNGDWVAGSDLSALELLATLATSGFSFGAYNNFTSEAGFSGAVSKTGFTRIVVSSSRHEGNNTPTGNEYIKFDEADTAGTSQDPKLVVVALSPLAFPFAPNSMQPLLVR